jgi:hypothetical protein
MGISSPFSIDTISIWANLPSGVCSTGCPGMDSFYDKRGAALQWEKLQYVKFKTLMRSASIDV